MTRRAYKFRCYPTDEQKQILARTFGGSRWVYNWAVRLKGDVYREAGKRLSSDDLSAWAKVERPESEALVLSDIGSGLGAARKRLQQLLKLVCGDRVAEVAMTSGDRLTRFGQEYLEMLFTSLGVAFTVLDLDEENTPEQELTEDLLSSIASFLDGIGG